MPASKTFTTVFQLAAKYTGQSAFAKLNKDIDRTQRNVKATSAGFSRMWGNIGKVTTAIGGAAVAYKALTKAQDFWRMGVAASKEAVDVQEKLGVTAEQNAKKYGQSGQAIVDSVNKTSEAIASLGFDTEDVQVGVTQLLKSMGNTRQLQSMSQAFANITAKTKGAQPGMEGFRESAESINQAILVGKSPLFKQLGWTDQQIKAFKKLSQVQRYAAIQQYGMNQLAGEAVRVMGTTSGAIAKAEKAYEDLGQAVTGGAVANQGKVAESLERLYKSLLPAAEAIGEKLAPAFERWAKILEANGPGIARILSNITETILRLPDVAVWAKGLLDKIPVIFDLKAHMPAISKFFTNLWANTEKEFNALWPIISKFGTDLWANTLKEFENLAKIVPWIDENIIKPIAAFFDWLVKKISDAWNWIFPKLESLHLINQQANLPPGQGGEAWRRAEAGRAKASAEAGDKSKGYAPYQRGYYGPDVGALKDVRARFAEEIASNPAVRDKLLRVANAEVGTGNPQRTLAFMEGVMNRAASRKQTLDRALQADYYDTLRHGPLAAPSSPALAKQEAALSRAFAGSNISGFSTGNWSGYAGGGLGGRGGYNTAKFGGEQFSVQAADVKWAANMKAAEAATRMLKEPTDPQHPLGKPPGGTGITFTGRNAPAPPPPPKALTFPAGSSLKDTIKGINMKQRMEATGPTNVAMNPVINVNGASIPPGREGAIGREVSKAMKDPVDTLLVQLKRAKSREARLGYV